VRALSEMRVEDATGAVQVIAPDRYGMVVDTHRPKIVARSGLLPSLPTGGRVRLTFEAGFGPVWEDVPADLRQAVMLLAAHFYENRHDGGAQRAGAARGGA
jgi:uncharacterized phiE125 gp8 family phage protein